jgi:hypothetical protein
MAQPWSRRYERGTTRDIASEPSPGKLNIDRRKVKRIIERTA